MKRLDIGLSCKYCYDHLIFAGWPTWSSILKSHMENRNLANRDMVVMVHNEITKWFYFVYIYLLYHFFFFCGWGRGEAFYPINENFYMEQEGSWCSAWVLDLRVFDLSFILCSMLVISLLHHLHDSRLGPSYILCLLFGTMSMSLYK